VRTSDVARAMLQQAEDRLETASRALGKGNYAYTIRAAQECVELSLKAVLRLVGVEYPKRHDVSKVLLAFRERFPAWFKVETYAEASRALAEKRELAMYGDELRMVTASALFTKEDAEQALADAEAIHRDSVRLLEAVSQL